jgi:hypothetical protein
MEAKKLHFRFASFRFEAKMTAHPTTHISYTHARTLIETITFKFRNFDFLDGERF